ncbi:alpha-L-fucosidase [Compostibacter hankyongensis]|uniref:alpha-L-fucosidase n=1 Tax=Compostibacter hankyongensis TaxID=1007089 RepID=A0ABP8FC56_9BACT
MSNTIFLKRLPLLALAVFLAACSGQPRGEGESQAPADSAALLAAGEKRDSLAAAAALDGWWKASMRNHDRRIAWWREARFGCFIHWGVYSLAGGEWKGKPVKGYAEHLMRIKKIPLAEYKRDLVEKFNPQEFDADEWVRRIRATGMRYLIITSKHHDGFAMYDSDVKDYNIVKATPFHRDPMLELAAACKKYGIRFGFYYSQAFDWEDPDAPGNDWDYQNPGGDLHLFGGTHWFDYHPDMLTRIRKYVDGKSIPQIRELIRKYHPDILWFDTPSKLPFSENLRILEEIRKIDSTVVIDGRLANYGEYHFGDYQSTSDRPQEFFPVTGDWEAIPTTNESYGYSRYDSSHKPFSHFIRLLAKAASRGGNLLMNVGPMGNGEMDPRDTAILYRIGLWMQQNGTSIYGTTATPLPLQPWGVSTRRGNKLFLQVFHWPANGQLVVGGLESQPAKTYLLRDAAQTALPVKRLNPRDLAVSLPRPAPDTVSTVVVMEFKDGIAADTVRRLSATRYANRLLAFDSRLHGKGLRYGDGKASRYYVYHWNNPGQWMSWSFRLEQPAVFRVSIKYSTDADNRGITYRITVAGQTLEKKVQVPAHKDRIYTEEIGTVKIPSGLQELSIRPAEIRGNEVMKLFGVTLTPIR